MYRVGLVVWQLGWVDLDLGSSPGWWAAAAATNYPSTAGWWNQGSLTREGSLFNHLFVAAKSGKSQLISSKSMGKSIPPTLSKPHLPILLKEISRLSVDFAATASLLCRGCWFPFSPFNFFGPDADEVTFAPPFEIIRP